MSTGSAAESGEDYCEQNNSDYWVWTTEGGGKEECHHYIMFLHKYKTSDSLLLAGQYLCRTYITLRVITNWELPPSPTLPKHYSDHQLGKKFLSYIECPSYSFLYTGTNIQDGMDSTQDFKKISHREF